MARQQAQRARKFLVWSPEHDTPRRARAYLVTDDDVTDAVARYVPARPQLDTISRLALAEGSLPLAPQPPAEPSPDRYANVADGAEPPGDGAAGQRTRTRSSDAGCPLRQPKAFPSATSSRSPA